MATIETHSELLPNPVSVLILEDKEDQLRSLSKHLGSIENVGPIFAVQSYEEARAIVDEGKCDIFYTDLIIEREEGGKINARRILKSIRDKEMPIVCVATSAHEEELEQIEEDGLANAVIRKDADADYSLCISRTTGFVARSFLIREKLLLVYSHLVTAVETCDFQLAADEYLAAKHVVSGIRDLEYVPELIHEIVWTIRVIVFFLAPFESSTVGLRKLDSQGLHLLGEVILGVNTGSAKLRTESTRNFNKLRAMGYQIRPLSDTPLDAVI